MLEETFRKACEHVKQSGITDSSVLLGFYGLYKQATEGDCSQGFSFNPSQELKRKSWMALKGMSREEAMTDYIELANEFEGTSIGGSVSKPVYEEETQELSELQAKVQLLTDSVKSEAVDLELLASLGVDAKDFEGLTCLHHAVNESLVNQVKFLLSQGADVNSQDQLLMTPLHYAAATDNLEIVEILLSTPGVDLSLKDDDGLLPVDLAGPNTKPLLDQAYA